MIERTWSARTDTRKAGLAYAEYFQRVVLPELAAVPGYRGARLLQRDLRGGTEIVVISRWDSLDAIRGFAGDNIDHAVVHTEAAALFSDYDHSVRHFEVVREEPA
jgi:heme-degrading monooxygenase HmoA